MNTPVLILLYQTLYNLLNKPPPPELLSYKFRENQRRQRRIIFRAHCLLNQYYVASQAISTRLPHYRSLSLSYSATTWIRAWRATLTQYCRCTPRRSIIPPVITLPTLWTPSFIAIDLEGQVSDVLELEFPTIILR